MAQAIPDHAQGAFTDHLLAHNVPATGGDIIFVVAANDGYPFEVFYSWVTVPAVDGTTGFFEQYTPRVTPNVYTPYRELEVPLDYWQHNTWLAGALPNVYLPVRMGPLSLPGASWPLLAGYAPHPLATTTASLQNLRLLYTALVSVYRAVIQFVSRTMHVLPTHVGPPPAGTAGGVTISPVIVNSVMGKKPPNRDDYPYWLAEKFGQLEAVFPHTSPVDRHRILTISLPKDLLPDIADCGTWGRVFAAVYLRCFGSTSMAVLPTLIKRVQEEHGSDAALELGMM